MLKVLVMVAPLVLSTAAFAGPTRFSDAQYVAAARCQALMASPVLGRQDTHGIDQVLKAQSASRGANVFDMADEAREAAQRAASHAGPYNKSQLVAERDGVCQALVNGGTVSASAAPAGASRTN